MARRLNSTSVLIPMNLSVCDVKHWSGPQEAFATYRNHVRQLKTDTGKTPITR